MDEEMRQLIAIVNRVRSFVWASRGLPPELEVERFKLCALLRLSPCPNRNVRGGRIVKCGLYAGHGGECDYP
jgi:hypothetical protein